MPEAAALAVGVALPSLEVARALEAGPEEAARATVAEGASCGLSSCDPHSRAAWSEKRIEESNFESSFRVGARAVVTIQGLRGSDGGHD